LDARIGQELGVSEWVAIDQARIDTFASCTGDRQWIHVDVERAKRESPFRGPIAHGYLTLAMVAPLAMQIGVIPKDAAAGLNYGIDKVRFLAPVPAGARVRLRVVLAGVEPRDGGQAIMKTQNTLEVEDLKKTCLDCRNACASDSRDGRKSMTGTENRTELPSSDGISEQASRNTMALNPLVGISGQDLVDSAGVLFKAIVNEPKVAAEQWLSLLGELGAIAGGKSERAPKAGDKRFSDPAWKESGLHSGLLKAYLAWGGAVSGLVDKTSLSDIDKARAPPGHGNPDRCGRADQCNAEPTRRQCANSWIPAAEAVVRAEELLR